MITCIKIDPVARTVEPFKFAINAPDDYSSMFKALYAAIGTDDITSVTLRSDTVFADCGWHDDVGMFKNWDKQGFFRLNVSLQPMAGTWVIVGCANPGHDDEAIASTRLPINLVRNAVQWLDAKDVQVQAPVITTVENGEVITSDVDVWTYESQPT